MFEYFVGSYEMIRTVYVDLGGGVLHITSQRVCFNGIHTIAIPYKKMVCVNGFEGGFIVQTSNENKPATREMLLAAR